MVHPELQLNVYPSSEESICIWWILNFFFSVDLWITSSNPELKVTEIDYGTCKNENGSSMNMERWDEKHICTHIWSRKKQNGEKTKLKPYTNIQGIF